MTNAPPAQAPVLGSVAGESSTAPIDRLRAFVEHVGGTTLLGTRALRALFSKRFEARAIVYQLEQTGVRSLAIAATTSIFVGIVMAIQFAHSLEKFGAKDTVGRIVGLSMTRELAPSLTALVVGSRIAAGMAAEIGAMSVTEQIDAIRALGADPIRKLVVPRLVAATIVLPMLTCFALVLGVASAMVICNMTFAVPMSFFMSSLFDQVAMRDFASGLGKTPFFGFLIALLGSYFGLQTHGGTEGVGRSTTRAVVAVSITVLAADVILTQTFLSL